MEVTGYSLSNVDQYRSLAIPVITTTGLFGAYLAIFFLALFSTKLGETRKASVAQRRAIWAMWATGILLLLRQGTGMSRLGNFGRCSLQVDKCIQKFKEEDPNITRIRSIVRLVIPPFVALLSDGILAWRVYVVWKRLLWIQLVLVAALVVNFALGITAAIIIVVQSVPFSNTMQGNVHPAFKLSVDTVGTQLYKAWVWAAFFLSSAMTASILFRIRALGDKRQQGINRYAYVLRAIMESAVVSWIATFGSAIMWSVKSACNLHINGASYEPRDCMLAAFEASGETTGAALSATFLSVIPMLLGISQVLIITRVNMSRFATTRDLAKTITVVSNEWEGSAHESRYDVTLGHMQVLVCPHCYLECCGCEF